MGHIYLDEGEEFQDEKATPCSSNNSMGLEEYICLGFMALGVKTELEKTSNKCGFVSNVKYPFCSKLNSPENIRFFSLFKNLLQYYIDLEEERAPSSPNPFRRIIASLRNIPFDPRSSEFFIESLKQRKRTRSTNNIGDRFVEYAAAAGPGNVIISPSVQWIFDSMEGTLMSRTFLKSPLLLQLGTLDSASRPTRGRASQTRLTKMSADWSGSPSEFSFASSQECKAEVTSSSQRSNLKISERLLVSCSSTNSATSYQSISSQNQNIFRGQLHRVWKNGSAYYIFSVGEDSGKFFIANPHKVEPSVNKALDYIYLFYMRTRNKVAEFVGNMKVLSTLVFTSDNSKLMETEFVLFGASKDHSSEMKVSASTAMKSKGLLSKNMAEVFGPSQSSNSRSTCKVGEQSSHIEDFLLDPCLSELTDLRDSPVNYFESDFPPNLELVSIVVKDAQQNINQEASIGGWGLRFLKKVVVGHVDNSLHPSSSSESCEGSHTKSRGASDRTINVLVPAGFHGGPITRNGGPSSIIERWRSGGHCDCGGWDIGCPLTVLQDRKSTVSNALAQEESQEDCNTVYLYVEGAKHGEPTLKMVNMKDDMYIIYFQSTLSALQSFSIGLALIHTQTPAFYPNL